MKIELERCEDFSCSFSIYLDERGLFYEGVVGGLFLFYIRGDEIFLVLNFIGRVK